MHLQEFRNGWTRRLDRTGGFTLRKHGSSASGRIRNRLGSFSDVDNAIQRPAIRHKRQRLENFRLHDHSGRMVMLDDQLVHRVVQTLLAVHQRTERSGFRVRYVQTGRGTCADASGPASTVIRHSGQMIRRLTQPVVQAADGFHQT